MFIFDEVSPELDFPKYNKYEDNFDEELHETIQEIVVSEPIYDNDSLQGDQLADIVVFHEDVKTVMFVNLEEYSCLRMTQTMNFRSMSLRETIFQRSSQNFSCLRNFQPTLR